MRLELVANFHPAPRLTPESASVRNTYLWAAGPWPAPPPDHGGSLSGKPQITGLDFSQQEKAFGGKAKMRAKEKFPLRNQQ